MPRLLVNLRAVVRAVVDRLVELARSSRFGKSHVAVFLLLVLFPLDESCLVGKKKRPSVSLVALLFSLSDTESSLSSSNGGIWLQLRDVVLFPVFLPVFHEICDRGEVRCRMEPRCQENHGVPDAWVVRP
ncbi:hypothetical protein [Sicyoidochytrium minutum DNA virus]|nr:hypothetical protein [Sicyoidochytrium minutum DNA virus]